MTRNRLFYCSGTSGGTDNSGTSSTSGTSGTSSDSGTSNSENDEVNTTDELPLSSLVNRTHLSDFPFCGGHRLGSLPPVRVVGGEVYSAHGYPGLCSLQARESLLAIDASQIA